MDKKHYYFLVCGIILGIIGTLLLVIVMNRMSPSANSLTTHDPNGKYCQSAYPLIEKYMEKIQNDTISQGELSILARLIAACGPARPTATPTVMPTTNLSPSMTITPTSTPSAISTSTPQSTSTYMPTSSSFSY